MQPNENVKERTALIEEKIALLGKPEDNPENPKGLIPILIRMIHQVSDFPVIEPSVLDIVLEKVTMPAARLHQLHAITQEEKDDMLLGLQAQLKAATERLDEINIELGSTT